MYLLTVSKGSLWGPSLVFDLIFSILAIVVQFLFYMKKINRKILPSIQQDEFVKVFNFKKYLKKIFTVVGIACMSIGTDYGF